MPSLVAAVATMATLGSGLVAAMPHIGVRQLEQSSQVAAVVPRAEGDGIVLSPVRKPRRGSGPPGAGKGFLKTSDVELQEKEEVFFRTNGVYAKGTITAKGDASKLVSYGRIADDTSSLACPSDSEVVIEFTTKDAYSKAQSSWTSENFYFVGSDECGGDSGLQAYMIWEASFDEASQKATLKGEVKDWDDVLQDVKFRASTSAFDGLGDEDGEERKRADWEGQGTADMSKFDISDTELVGKDVDDFRIGLTCAECGLTGSLEYDLSFDAGWSGIDIYGRFKTANSFGAKFALGLSVKGELTQELSADISFIPEILLTPISVPLGFKLGIYAAPLGTATLGAVSGELEAKFGGAMTVPDGIELRFGTDSEGGDSLSDIEPAFSNIGPEASAAISVDARLAAGVAIGVRVGAFDKTVAAGIGLEAPTLDATLTATTSTNGGACGKDDMHSSLDLVVDTGVTLSAFWGSDPMATLPRAFELYKSPPRNLIDQCFPFGGDDGSSEEDPVGQGPKCSDDKRVGYFKDGNDEYHNFCNPGGDASTVLAAANTIVKKVWLDSGDKGVDKCSFYRVTHEEKCDKNTFITNSYPGNSVGLKAEGLQNVCVICV